MLRIKYIFLKYLTYKVFIGRFGTELTICCFTVKNVIKYLMFIYILYKADGRLLLHLYFLWYIRSALRRLHFSLSPTSSKYPFTMYTSYINVICQPCVGHHSNFHQIHHTRRPFMTFRQGNVSSDAILGWTGGWWCPTKLLYVSLCMWFCLVILYYYMHKYWTPLSARFMISVCQQSLITINSFTLAWIPYTTRIYTVFSYVTICGLSCVETHAWSGRRRVSTIWSPFLSGQNICALSAFVFQRFWVACSLCMLSRVAPGAPFTNCV